jgi:hypothetical protein
VRHNVSTSRFSARCDPPDIPIGQKLQKGAIFCSSSIIRSAVGSLYRFAVHCGTAPSCRLSEEPGRGQPARTLRHAVPPPEPGTMMIVKTASLPRLSGPRSEGRGFALP